MSGSAGGNRITRAVVEDTVQDYIKKVLSKFPGFKTAKVTGSYNAGTKQDFGDIDLIVQLDGTDKKIIKQDLAKYFATLPDSIIVPFKSDKYKGKKSLSSGELVTILYPIAGVPGDYVQIDNIVSISEEESTFKNTFLDYSAEVQGLLLGLAKVICLEEDPKEIFKRLGITNIPALEPNQEYEFNLSGVGLTLRIVTLDNFKETERTDAWKSSDWSTVKKLFANYNIDVDFKTLLKELVSKLKNQRSKNRVKGIFKSMVSIKSGEVGTPKGENKQISLDAVDSMLENMLFKGLVKELLSGFIAEEITKESIALYPGKFKPPHKGHFEVAKQLLEKVDKVEIIISPKEVEGITAEKSKAIWELYNKLLGGKLDIKIINESPVTYTLDTIAGNFKIGNLQKAKEISDDTWVKDMINIIKSSGEKGISQKELISKLGPIKDLTSKIKEFLENGIIEKTNKNNHYVAVYGKGEESRYINVGKDPRYMNAEIFDGGTTTSGGENINATDFRNAIRSGEDISRFIPDGINKKVVSKDLETDSINEHCGCDTSLPTTLKDAMLSLTTYMIENDMNILPLPKIKIIDDDSKNAEGIFGSTAYYNPNDCSVTLYTLNRHPKDILRSYAHEMIHRIQDNEGRLKNITTTNTNEDSDLLGLEKEAYLNGNITIRKWEDSLKNPKPVKEVYFLDTEKYNRPRTIHENLWHTLNEITLTSDNAVETYGNLDRGKFQVGNTTYMYDIKQVSNPYNDGGRFFNIMFHPEDNKIDTPTGTSTKENYIKILSTMYKVILNFSKETEPEYIGISSMDNAPYKNYHMVYANLTDNKFNRIPGYFRKDVNLEFNTPQGKGRFVVLKRKDEPLNEGRYDTVSNKSSSMIFNKWKQDFLAGKKQSVLKTFVENDDVEFGLVAMLKFKNEGEDLKVDGGLEETENGNVIYVDFEVDKNVLPEMWSEISMNLKDVMRHEIEHITQNDELNYPSKFMEDDLIARIAINQKLLPRGEYFKLEKEIDANLQGMYFRAKKEKRPFIDVINDYLDAQSITPEQKEEVLNLWRPRASKLSLLKF
jgi:cytidyltransferase-like protein